jgi:hypothetical protein
MPAACRRCRPDAAHAPTTPRAEVDALAAMVASMRYTS